MNYSTDNEKRYYESDLLETISFSISEIEMVNSAIIVPTTAGPAVRFQMKSGISTHLPLDPQDLKAIGEIIDLKEAKLINRKTREGHIIQFVKSS